MAAGFDVLSDIGRSGYRKQSYRDPCEGNETCRGEGLVAGFVRLRLLARSPELVGAMRQLWCVELAQIGEGLAERRARDQPAFA
jgi:hypothetical protein